MCNFTAVLFYAKVKLFAYCKNIKRTCHVLLPGNHISMQIKLQHHSLYEMSATNTHACFGDMLYIYNAVPSV